MVVHIALMFLAYLLGSIPFGKIIGFFNSIDIQKKGSGNIGFANVYRVMGARPAVLVLCGDVFKGYIPTVLAQRLNFSMYEIFAIGLVAIIGHIFPIWLRFKGGKGIATSFGLLLALSPTLATLGILIWLIVLEKTKIFSLASLSAAWSIFLVSCMINTTRIYSLGIFCTVLLGTIFHKDNIQRIISGKEPKSWKW